MISVAGWDIGGANVKAAWLERQAGHPDVTRTVSLPFEIWREKDRLPAVLSEGLSALSETPPDAMAITMTAELADVFATKREGVTFVLDSVLAALPGSPAYALSLEGQFVPVDAALEHPLAFAAANWLATAMWVAREQPDCVLIDVGTTTTDIIPIVAGQVVAEGRTDLARLLAGELVYTGAVRTNAAAIASHVPVRGQRCPVSSEYFAVSGDVHLILGLISPKDYSCPTPDGRAPAVESARGRLARLVCADAEQLTRAEIDEIARCLHDCQTQQIASGLRQVLARVGGPDPLPVVAIGIGAFLAQEAARQLGVALADMALGGGWDAGASEVAPAWAVAHLLADRLEAGA